MSSVVIQEASYDNCDKSIEKVFTHFQLNLEGKKVLIKPNVLRSAAPEEGITTHPAVLNEVIRAVARRSPASIVVGDNPGVYSYGVNEKTFRDTGLMEVAGSFYRNLGSDTVQLEMKSRFIQNILVPRAVLEADVYISVSKFKTHGLTGLSCAIKNNFGLLPGGLKARFHKTSGNPHDFAEALVDVFTIRIPDLVIVDGVLAMEGNGPVSTQLLRLGKILAGDDAVAVDAVVARMMGFSTLPRTVELAAAKGLGTSDLSKINIIGQLETIPGFKLPPPLAPGLNSSLPGLNWGEVTSVRPSVDTGLCNLCHTCIEHCPAGALVMEDHPVVQPELCITCFCCQELCPQNAIKLQ